MNGVQLLRSVAEAETQGKPLPASVTRVLVEGVLHHITTGESLDLTLGLSGSSRGARYRFRQSIVDAALFEVYSRITHKDRLGVLSQVVQIFADGFTGEIPENADESFLALHRAFSTGLPVPRSRGKLRKAIQRHLDRQAPHMK